MRIVCFSLILTVSTVFGAGASSEASGRETAASAAKEVKVTLAPGIGNAAAPLEGLNWIKGKPVKIEPGKAYLIEFWATWCPPCRESIPHLTQLQKTYGDKITVIGVTSEKPETAKPFVEKMGALMDYHVAADPDGKVTKNYSHAYNQQGIPHAFIVDQKGKIVWYGHLQEGMDYILSQVATGAFDTMEHARKVAEAEALNQQLTEWYFAYFSKIQEPDGTEEAKRIAASFIEKAHPEALLAFAWNILVKVHEDDAVNKEIALKAAEKANVLTSGTEPVVLDTYATALFENGRIDEAITAETKAVELSEGYPQMQENFRKRLLEFKTKTYQNSPARRNRLSQ
jgi:thiol-disulfide isomerase/thioredoxin